MFATKQYARLARRLSGHDLIDFGASGLMAGNHDSLKEEIPSRYTQLSRLGAGGVGIVFKAHDSYLNKAVAIKMLLVSTTVPDIVGRFQREAKLASLLDHANIITVLDFGVTERSKPYMVMEFVEGKTLDNVIAERQSLTIDECYPIFIQVCEAIAHAHKRGVLHRDLKPSNVILTNLQSELPLVKILDFGLAKLEGVAGETLTQMGTVLGSPLYMSPEQAQGQESDHRSDIYAIGVLMYETLTGHVPISGDTALETLSQKSMQPAPLMNREKFPARLCEIVDRCLKINPKERYQSVEALEAALVALGEEWEHNDRSLSQSVIMTLHMVRARKSSKAWIAPLVAVAILCITAFAFYVLHPVATISTQSSTIGWPSPLSDNNVEMTETDVQQRFRKLPKEAAEEEPDADQLLRKKLQRYLKNAYKTAVSFDEAKRYCRYDDGDPAKLKIIKLENFLDTGKVCDFVYNELRHQYLVVGDEKTSMEYSNILCYRKACNSYVMNCIDRWTYDKKEYAACLTRLGEVGSKYKQMQYLHASCIIRCGQAAQRLNQQSAARAYFETAVDDAPDRRYRELAQNLLAAVGK